VTGPEPPSADPEGRLHLSMLQEIYDLGLDAAGGVWPTPPMALGRLFERGAAFLDADASLARIVGRASTELLDALNICREDLFLVEALYLLTRHVTYVLTDESNTLEAVWLGLADRHLQIHAEIVARRRDEEQLKRQLRALGGAAVPLPEHGDLAMAGGDRPRKSRGMYQHLFDGAALCESDLVVSSAALTAADRAAKARGWDREWGPDARLLVLTQGISLALRERESDSIDADSDESVQEAHAEARRRLMGLEGRYSTLRRRLFELRHNNRVLRWRITALEVEAAGMRSRLDQFLVDRDRLEQAIAERVAAGASATTEATGHGQRQWRRRLGRLFGRGR
jgi:hypothetical protein